MELALGDVQAERAILWVAAEADEVLLRIRGDGRRRNLRVAVAGSAHVELELRPATTYSVEAVWKDERATATFHTPPAPEVMAPLRLAWGGDLGGQDACRDASAGYPIFGPLLADPPDFFVAVGDLVYADGACSPTGRFGNLQHTGPGPATTAETYADWWRYNLDDPGFAALRSIVPQVNAWDDHEVVNDFGPETDRRSTPPYAGEALMPLGLRAMRAHNPMPTEGPLYRQLRWGKAAELFVLDTRSYRSPNDAADGPGKTMLGATQKAWLVDAVTKSDATWKILVSGSPFGPPSSKPRDGWAEAGGPGGFLHEALELLGALKAEKNLLILTTDVHFATAARFHPFADSPDFAPVELVSGPMHAGLFPSRELEPKLAPELLFWHGPDRIDGLDFATARGFFNVGRLDIAADGTATASWVDANGRVVGTVVLPAR